MTHAGDRVLWLDGWRGSALVLVLASHFGGPEYLGRFGVDLFFVLSGILMARLLYFKQQPLPAFFTRRAARILPAFLVYTVTIFSIERFYSDSSTWTEIASTLLFLRTYIPADSDRWLSELPLAHLWSLNVEEHSYLFLALTATAVSRRVRIGAGIAIGSPLGAVAFYVLYRQAPPDTVMPYASRTECAALPLLLAAGLHLLTASQPRRVHPAWAPALLCLDVVLVVLFPNKTTITLMLSPVLLAMAINLLLITQEGTPLTRALSWQPLRWVGIASFSLYLWQQPAHFLIKHQTVSWPHWLGLGISLVLGICSFLLIETPARQWIYRRTGLGSA